MAYGAGERAPEGGAGAQEPDIAEEVDKNLELRKEEAMMVDLTLVPRTSLVHRHPLRRDDHAIYQYTVIASSIRRAACGRCGESRYSPWARHHHFTHKRFLTKTTLSCEGPYQGG